MLGSAGLLERGGGRPPTEEEPAQSPAAAAAEGGEETSRPAVLRLAWAPPDDSSIVFILVSFRKANPAMAGQYIKTSTRGENARIEYATSCMQGPRDEMQDYYTALLDLDGSRSTSFFGVFDGHGGHRVALYCSRKFHTELVKVPDYQNNNLHTALENVCFRIDQALKRSDEWKRPDSPPAPAPGNGSFRSRLQTSLCSCFGKNYEGPQLEGSTACVALIRGNQIIVGNVGDSRCVLSRNGQAIDLSTDHKPNEPGERARIEAAGGSVVRRQVLVYDASGRRRVEPGPYCVDGIIAVSRALGDFQFKKNNRLKLICNPDIHTENITDDIDFLLIASDGIWDVKTSEEVVTYVNERLQTRTDPHVICEGLLDWCRDSRDNSTVILVQFKNGNNPTANASCSGDSCPRPQAKITDPSSSIGAPKVDTKAEIKAAEE
ncbi:probable protein phosphatase 2C 21 [Lolium rigidum]|uniref:probable protein phosphatase 2C 21 n=1 Tax=Lolium rigidum TaxID=89674 RepID=UPI001F5D4649|nr:probable protein phosphatase 2C 21 [Lolium rigidum]